MKKGDCVILEGMNRCRRYAGGGRRMVFVLAAGVAWGACAHAEPKCPLPGDWVLDKEVNDWSGAKVSELNDATLPATAKVDWFRRWCQK